MANAKGSEERCIFSCLVQNNPGVLAQVSGLFAGRGYNIDSLTVGETENPQFSRMTIASHGDEQVLDQIRKQLEKLVPAVKVVDLTGVERVERELALVKIAATPAERGAIMQLAEIFRARVVDVGEKELLLELSGRTRKVEAFIDLIRPYGIRELARTGVIAMARGATMTGARRAAEE